MISSNAPDECSDQHHRDLSHKRTLRCAEPCSARVTAADGLNQMLAVATAAISTPAQSGPARTMRAMPPTLSSDSKSFTIVKAGSATTINCPANVTYNGSDQTPCSAMVTGAGLSQSLTVAYANNINAGTAHASASQLRRRCQPQFGKRPMNPSSQAINGAA